MIEEKDIECCEEKTADIKEKKLSNAKIGVVLLCFVVSFTVNNIATKYYDSYKSGVAELIESMNNNDVEKSKSLVDDLSKLQTKKAVDKYTDEMIENCRKYQKNGSFSADFYVNLITELTMLNELKKIDDDVKEEIPDFDYCFSEAFKNDDLTIAEDYRECLETCKIGYSEEISEKLDVIVTSRKQYEEALSYFNKEHFDQALEICQKIVTDPDDKETSENVKTLNDKIIEQDKENASANVESLYSSGNYQQLFAKIEDLETKYADDKEFSGYSDKYLPKCIDKIKDEMKADSYDSAYIKADELLLCFPENKDIENLYQECTIGYIKLLMKDYNYDDAHKIAEEALKKYPDNSNISELNESTLVDKWRVGYSSFLSTGFSNANGFALYKNKEYENPFLAIVYDDSYEIYYYDEKSDSVELKSQLSNCSGYDSKNDLFLSYSYSTGSGYFEHDYYYNWTTYKFNGSEFEIVDEYSKSTAEHYYAITNQVYESSTFCTLNSESISTETYDEFESNAQDCKAMECSEINEQNIKNKILEAK